MASRDTFTAKVPSEIIEDQIYTFWENELDESLYIRVQSAIDKIKNFGIITSVKSLGDGLYEKKWKSGLRLYFAIVSSQGQKTLLLLGSGKGREQNKAILKSKSILINYEVVFESILKKD